MLRVKRACARQRRGGEIFVLATAAFFLYIFLFLLAKRDTQLPESKQFS